MEVSEDGTDVKFISYPHIHTSLVPFLLRSRAIVTRGLNAADA